MTERKKPGRKSKCNPETIELLLRTIIETGSDSLACEAAGVSRDAFYRWLKENPEFATQVAEARSNRLQETSQTVWDRKQKAEDYIDEIIKGTKFKIIRQQTFNPSGEIVTLIREEQVMLSEKLIERILGQTQADMKVEVSFGVVTPEDDD